MIERARPPALPPAVAVWLGLCLVGAGSIGEARAETSFRETLRFAAEMARAGNWREAKYRWELAARRQPDNPFVLNNLAVASEALGQVEEARALYGRALALADGDERIESNRLRSERFWRQTRTPDDSNTDGANEPAEAVGAPIADGRSKAIKVSVSLPVPARLDLGEARRLLVASFLADENTLLDTNRELVRFLRNEFRKRTSLEVLEITPPPAVPEQTLDDLEANRGFWQHLGREYGADLIVSGAVSYDRRDASGFQTVDETSPTTGQKVRQTRFVEQEEFIFEVIILFMDGATGEKLFRDRLQRGALFRSQQNDPITAFYDLSESIAGDVLAVVTPLPRQDTRVIFRD